MSEVFKRRGRCNDGGVGETGMFLPNFTLIVSPFNCPEQVPRDSKKDNDH